MQPAAAALDHHLPAAGHHVRPAPALGSNARVLSLVRKPAAAQSLHRALRRPPLALAATAGMAAAAFAFTPLESALAGLTLGLAAHAKLSLTGRILGISGAVRGIVQGSSEAWRIAFVLGLAAGGAALHALLPGAFELLPAAFTLRRAVAAGLLVGLGTSRGSGCTSGHGICGNARLSPRSFAATCSFMAAGAVAARLADSAAVFALPHGIAPLAAPTAASLTFGAGLLAAACATWLSLHLAAKRLTAPTRVPSSAMLDEELKQAGRLEQTALAGEPPAAAPDAEKLAALSTAADLFIGLIFALGLGASGMLKPSKVVGFLSVLAGTWDPSLMLVMGGALAVALPAFQLTLRRTQAPLCAPCYELPTKRSLDANLILGSLLFGAGWGIGGMCPGPALVSLATLQPKVLVFVAAMAAGMRLDHTVEAVACRLGGSTKAVA